MTVMDMRAMKTRSMGVRTAHASACSPLGAWGDCDAGSSSAMSAQSASSPESLLGDLGFESVEAFTAWLEELEPALAEQVVAILGILLEGGDS
jgi:hypothetical protein